MAKPNVETSMAPPAGNAVPRCAEDLSPDWLTACLRHCGAIQSASVVGFDTERIGVGQGFAGQLRRIRLTYDRTEASAPVSLIGKFVTDHESTREMLDMLGGYEREVRFYRELGDDVGMPIPRCYFAHYDTPTRTFLLLLEDLAPAAPPTFEEGLNLEQAQELLGSVARFHAHWWNRHEEVPWLMPAEEIMAGTTDGFLAALDGFLERYGDQYPHYAGLARKLAVVMDEEFMAHSIKQFTKPPMTLTHTDLHSQNIMLPTAQGGRFAIIDWQLVMFTAGGAGDVASIMVGLRPELRRKHGRRLLRLYHRTLCEHGVKDYSYYTFQRRYGEQVAAKVIMGVSAMGRLDYDGSEALLECNAVRMELVLKDLHANMYTNIYLFILRGYRLLRRLVGKGAQRTS